MDTPSTIRTDGAVATDTIECCCHRADCSYTRQYRDTLDRLEREAALAGEAGLESTQGKLKAAVRLVQDKESEIQAFQAENNELVSRLSRIDSEYQAATDRYHTLSKQLNESRYTIARLSSFETRIHDLEQHADDLAFANETFQEQLKKSQAVIKSAEQRHTESLHHIDTLELLLHEVTTDRDEQVKRFAEHNDATQRMLAELRESRTECQKTVTPTVSMKKDMSTPHSLHDALAENTQLQRQMSNLKRLLCDSQTEAARLRERLAIMATEQEFDNVVHTSFPTELQSEPHERVASPNSPTTTSSEVHIYHHFPTGRLNRSQGRFPRSRMAFHSPAGPHRRRLVGPESSRLGEWPDPFPTFSSPRSRVTQDSFSIYTSPTSVSGQSKGCRSESEDEGVAPQLLSIVPSRKVRNCKQIARNNRAPTSGLVFSPQAFRTDTSIFSGDLDVDLPQTPSTPTHFGFGNTGLESSPPAGPSTKPHSPAFLIRANAVGAAPARMRSRSSFAPLSEISRPAGADVSSTAVAVLAARDQRLDFKKSSDVLARILHQQHDDSAATSLSGTGTFGRVKRMLGGLRSVSGSSYSEVLDPMPATQPVTTKPPPADVAGSGTEVPSSSIAPAASSKPTSGAFTTLLRSFSLRKAATIAAALEENPTDNIIPGRQSLDSALPSGSGTALQSHRRKHPRSGVNQIGSFAELISEFHLSSGVDPPPTLRIESLSTGGGVASPTPLSCAGPQPTDEVIPKAQSSTDRTNGQEQSCNRPVGLPPLPSLTASQSPVVIQSSVDQSALAEALTLDLGSIQIQSGA